jgi:hypothetical protein
MVRSSFEETSEDTEETEGAMPGEEI